MGLFKKKRNEYDEAKKSLNENNEKNAFERTIFEKLTDDDKRAAELVLEIKSGNPVVIDFGLLDNEAANKMLSFFIGASFALDGETVKINKTVFLFARRMDFVDGSLKEFLNRVSK